MKYTFLLLCFFLIHPAMGQSMQKHEDMIVDGIKRSFVSYIPANGNGKMPLIISLHGGLASPKGQFRLADFRPLADRDKFIVVCPASKHIWHDGRDNKGIDDVKFMDKLISLMVDKYHADPQRVYITGISNGGFMASRLACQLSSRIAAIGVVAGTMNVEEGYAPVKPMPVIYMHGTKDRVFSNKGGKAFGRLTYSHNDVVKLWVNFDKCNPEPVITNIPDTAHDGTSVICEEYRNPANGIEVIGYTIVNGGHTWPGGWQYMPRWIVGKTTKNINACAVMWDFLKKYKLNLTPDSAL
ncbi:alpha/beta hydrolase family esterase [Mucilaginibacter sp. AW1-3]